MTRHIEELIAQGEIGGRTVRILETGEVDCYSYPVPSLADGAVRVRSARTMPTSSSVTCIAIATGRGSSPG